MFAMTKFRHALTLSATLLLAPWSFAQSYTVPANTPAHIARGIAAADRTEEMTVRDAARKPAETLMVAGLGEGAHIAEITAMGLYYSTILSAALGPQGQLDMYDMPYMERFGAIAAGQAFAAAHPNSHYTNVHYNDIAFAPNLDAVYNILYYHDLKSQDVDPAALNAKIFAALKPGGVYFVVDHRAEDGSGWRDSGTIHRIGKEVILQEVTAAGFELAQDSDLLANPADDKSKMVFAPGTRGSTDQTVLVFRKPQ
jgi:predicted methyltransferase